MRKNKLILTTILTLSIAATLIGCGNSNDVVTTGVIEETTINETESVIIEEPTTIETVASNEIDIVAIEVVTEAPIIEQTQAPIIEAKPIVVEAPKVIEVAVPTEAPAPVEQYQLANFPFINQMPELPSGCETTSMTMALNYLGIAAEKCNLVDNWLPKGEIGSTNPNFAFVGNPRSDSSYGCYAPVITNTINNYTHSNIAYNTTGTSIDGLLEKVKAGKPVIIWATMYMDVSRPTAYWVVDGVGIQWMNREHCLVLIGMNGDNLVLADPLVGITEYNKSTFTNRFNQQGCQSVSFN